MPQQFRHPISEQPTAPFASTAADPEIHLIDALVQQAKREMGSVDPISIVNAYVALKAKPLLILVGPEGSGKLACTRSIMQTLSGKDPFQSKELIGHPWWANIPDSVSLFVEAQTRINTDILLGFVEDAWQPQNRRKTFFVCLSKISPGELTTYFSSLAFQLKHGEFIALPSHHLTQPVPFPSNLSLMATMDSERLDWADQTLLSQAIVTHWLPARGKTIEPLPPCAAEPDRAFGDVYLSSRIRDRRAAFQKLHAITGHFSGEFAPVMRVAIQLARHEVPIPTDVVPDIDIYLANAWSLLYNGLFNPSPLDNLQIALDYAIAQILLPYAAAPIRQSLSLASELLSILDHQFPHSRQFITTIFAQ